MAVKKKVKYHPDVVDYFKELPFYNKHIERLRNVDLLSELLFYEEIDVIKTDHAVRGYARSYKLN